MKLVNGMKVAEFKKAYTLPFRVEIPNSNDEIISKKSSSSSRIKFIKRYLYLMFKHQTSLEIDNILPEHQNILWINISAPSLGDSLMDLSSRIMLSDRKIDLFTDKKNVKIFKNDSFFSSVFDEDCQMYHKQYDLVIIDSYSTRSIRVKAKIASLVSYVPMFGYFNGPEVNRVLYSFHQMNSLLGYKKSDNEINRIAKPSISISKQDQKFIKGLELPQNFIAIVVGGEWSFRSFNRWDLLIDILIRLDSNIKIVLIGSDNGIDSANLIVDQFPNDRVLDYVAKFTFKQTTEIMNQAKYIVCCDGGLMHAANSIGAISVALLSKLNSDMQLTSANKCFSLYDDSNVNNISIDIIVNTCMEASNLAEKSLLNKLK
tara:strand:- start:3677 stop:4795 length:1119 start_codon:yes stop_codon:yes gene_type:complete